MIPITRILNRLDSYFAGNDIPAAERHLDYWRSEAESTGDKNGLLTILNEQMGLYRKAGDREKALACAEETVRLAEALCLNETVAGATFRINSATVHTAFGETGLALEYFREARTVYERELSANDVRLGSLYNNYATALNDAGQTEAAMDLYRMALRVMAQTPHGEGERAVTLLNMADAAEPTAPAEAEAYLLQAEQLLESPDLPHDGRYAFICEKCAPVFARYGHLEYGEKLRKRAETIYAGT